MEGRGEREREAGADVLGHFEVNTTLWVSVCLKVGDSKSAVSEVADCFTSECGREGGMAMSGVDSFPAVPTLIWK